MNSSRVVMKLGGSSLTDPSVLSIITQALKLYRKYDYQVILVHGGGPAINAELSRCGIEWSFVNGQRVTTPEMMGVIESVLCGDINRKLVRQLVSHGIQSVGFSGADCNTLLCKRASKMLGQVGAIKEVNTKWLEGLLALPGNPLPVIAPIGIGEQGEAYNINADWAASHLAVALKAEYLIYLTDQKGILDQQKELITQLSETTLKKLMRNQAVHGGMAIKTRTMMHALQNGVKAARVMDARDAETGLWSNYVGTWCLPKGQDIYQYVPGLRPREESVHVAS
ncbi:MAG: acetylglutamate kinase [Pseudomonadota bacterium]|nr:acetylglutamate kinase [Pseudomonadota bacterium]